MRREGARSASVPLLPAVALLAGLTLGSAPASPQAVFPDGAKIALEADSGLWMARCRNCQPAATTYDTVTVHVPGSGAEPPDPVLEPWAWFTVENHADGSLSLAADTGYYLARCRDCVRGGLYPDFLMAHAETSVSPAARFRLVQEDNGRYAVQSADSGLYLGRCAGCSPGATASDQVGIHASRTGYVKSIYPWQWASRAPDWAQWRVVMAPPYPTGARVALQADNGLWMARCSDCQDARRPDTLAAIPDSVTAHLSGSEPPDPDSETEAWFTVENHGDGTVSLRADSGLYLARCRGCIEGATRSDFLTIHASSSGFPWARFTLEHQGAGRYALKADTGRYVGRCEGCSPSATHVNQVAVHGENPESWATWKIASAPRFPNGTRVALQADSGRWMARCVGCLQASVPDTVTLHVEGAEPPDPGAQPSAWFTVENHADGTLSLQADTGLYLGRCAGCVFGKERDFLTVHGSSSTEPWARFHLVGTRDDGRFGLRAIETGRYVGRCAGCSPGAVADQVAIHGPQPVSWASWRIVTEPPLPTGSRVALQADNGWWMARCANCQEAIVTDTVMANLPDTGEPPDPERHPWAWFTVENHADGTMSLRADSGRYLARCHSCVSGGTVSDFLGAHQGSSDAAFARFSLERLGAGRFALEADTGLYVGRCEDCSPSATSAHQVAVHGASPESWAIWRIASAGVAVGSLPDSVRQYIDTLDASSSPAAASLPATPETTVSGDPECAPGHENDAGLCYPLCDAGLIGVGPVCWPGCPSEFIDDGLTCRKDAHIFAKNNYHRGAGEPFGCRSGEERDGLLCYPACSHGYKGVGPVCWEWCPSGHEDHGATCFKNVFDWSFKHSYGRGAGRPLTAECRGSLEASGFLCYPPCAAGHTGVGPYCWQSCPAGYTDDGAFCRKDVIVEGKDLNRVYGRGVGTVPRSLDGICQAAYPAYFQDGTPRRYDQMTWLTTHNAFATSARLFSHNYQKFDLRRQLDGGVRALMLDVHDDGGTAALCHGNCNRDGFGAPTHGPQSLESALWEIKSFLDDNPSQIVTLILESYLGGGQPNWGSADRLRDELLKVGLQGYLYHPEDPDWQVDVQGAWPTIEWMTQRNRRLVIFSNRGEENRIGAAAYAWSYYVETDYDLGALGDGKTECIKRGEGPSESQPLDTRFSSGTIPLMFVMSNIRELVSLAGAAQDNLAENLWDRIWACRNVSGRYPNFIGVDYYQHAYCNAQTVVNELNVDRWTP